MRFNDRLNRLARALAPADQSSEQKIRQWGPDELPPADATEMEKRLHEEVRMIDELTVGGRRDAHQFRPLVNFCNTLAVCSDFWG